MYLKREGSPCSQKFFHNLSSVIDLNYTLFFLAFNALKCRPVVLIGLVVKSKVTSFTHIMYRNNSIDPVLLKMDAATVSALNDAGVYCLEDLLQVDSNKIDDLPGIGPKRKHEIQQFLHSLPFDFTEKPSPINPDQDGFLGVDPVLREYITRLFYYPNEAYVTRGIAYFRENRVVSLRALNDKETEYEAHVKGSRQYTVSLPLEGGLTGEEHCTCPAFFKWAHGTNVCKHVVAAVFALAEQQRLSLFTSTEGNNPAYRQLALTLKSSRNGFKKPSGSEELEYMLVRENGNWDIYPKKIYAQLKSLNSYSTYSYSFDNPWELLDPGNARDNLIIGLLMQNSVSASMYSHGRHSRQSGNSTGEILELIRERNLYVKLDKRRSELTSYLNDPYRLFIEISRNKDAEGAALKIECKLENDGENYSADEVLIMDTDPTWILANGTIEKLEATDMALQLYYSTKGSHIDVPESELTSFLTELYPLMAQAGMTVKFSDDLKIQGAEADPNPRLYLSENGQRLMADLK